MKITKKNFSTFFISFISIFVIGCGSEGSNESDNLTGVAPDSFIASDTILTIVDDEQTRIITLNPSINPTGTVGQGGYKMEMRQYIRIGTNNTGVRSVFYRGSYTYNRSGSNTGVLIMTAEGNPDQNLFSTTGGSSFLIAATVVDPSTQWNSETLNLLFQNGSTSGNINSTKASNSGGTQTLGGTFSF
tara:strand:+ start:1086 stop:1649 length:564 start_codon:yes stop_codon:yes gene_type:complete